MSHRFLWPERALILLNLVYLGNSDPKTVISGNVCYFRSEMSVLAENLCNDVHFVIYGTLSI